MSALRTFVGFKGVCATVQIGKVTFMILARNSAQLEAIWTGILSAAGPFDPACCKPAILIESKLLPDSRVKPAQSDPSDPSEHTP